MVAALKTLTNLPFVSDLEASKTTRTRTADPKMIFGFIHGLRTVVTVRAAAKAPARIARLRLPEKAIRSAVEPAKQMQNRPL